MNQSVVASGSRLLVLSAVLLVGCRPSIRRLDDAPMHDGPGLRLKLVRYHENLPWHFSGEIGVVQCSSDGTRAVKAARTNDRGWVPLGRVSAIGSRTARELLPQATADYQVLNERTLVWKGTVLQVSFDGCATFAMWDPTSLPLERINPVAKPDHCAPKGTGDCRYYDFQGDRTPVYSEIAVTSDGGIEFFASSESFLPSRRIRVTSTDSGTTWQVAEAR
jgi:hypothetical protein